LPAAVVVFPIGLFGAVALGDIPMRKLWLMLLYAMWWIPRQDLSPALFIFNQQDLLIQRNVMLQPALSLAV
jgi:hypothetical protein